MEKFSLGQLVVTKGIQSKINSDVDFLINVLEILERYRRCDFGDLCDEDKALNEQALTDTDGGRIFAVYTCGNDKIWIITEHDRSVTTILLPEEY